jgi:hypothetical protein
MKKFLAIYLGTPGGFEKWMAMEEKKRKALEAKGMAEWGQWMQTHSQETVDAGGPLGKTKRVTSGGVADVRNAMSGYGVFSAESHEAAAKMFLGHPHFSVFPGESVEVMEILPIPGQA